MCPAKSPTGSVQHLIGAHTQVEMISFSREMPKENNYQRRLVFTESSVITILTGYKNGNSTLSTANAKKPETLYGVEEEVDLSRVAFEL